MVGFTSSSLSQSRPEPQISPPRVRNELKYIIPESTADAVRDYVQAFCRPDLYTEGLPPKYTVTTLQFDTPSLSFHLAKERKQVNRFKLRARHYGSEPNGKIYLEVKRKEELFVRKTRSRVPTQQFGAHLFQEPISIPQFANDEEYANHFEFVRLYQQCGAHPAIHIRYERESWIGDPDTQIRITMDRKLRYRAAEGYKFFGSDESGWRSMDTQTALRRSYAGCILEIKTPIEVPSWILYLIRSFDLQRSGFCKYSTAMRLESLFTGGAYSIGSERCHF